ncbi:hypothetical protein D9M72_343500 [compost metagenome]
MPGQQQGAGGAFTEARGKEGAPAHLGRHDLFQLLRIEEEQFGSGRLVLHHGHPQHNAVVRGHGGAVHPVALVQALPHRKGPGSVHGHAERAVQDHAPVAQLVMEPLHHQGGVAGDNFGGQLLFGEVLDQVVRGEII